ncbi:MAG: DUF4856 domain-containing protein [Flavobacteriaceae bacterium]|nr:DUF4856 domain-containing protein [Flavobacteriaceae bacterium]
MKKLLFNINTILLLFAFIFVSCDTDNQEDELIVVAPANYEFVRDGASTVSFSGQTARLNMADEIYNALNTNTFTKAQLLEMFNNGTGFSTDALNNAGKVVGSKTASGCNHGALAVTKARYTDMLEDFADNVIPAWTATASNGSAGLLTDSKRTINVNAKGWEVDQTFIKGIIGGMCVDQIVNNYLDPCQLDSSTRRDDNTNGVLSSGKNYTDMEHKWDEGFGYLYGQEEDASRADLGTSPLGNGTTLMKYFKKINDSNMPGISEIVFDAFKLGRAAIVAGDYELRDAQAKIIMIHLSKVVGYKAVDYLEGYMDKMAAGNNADAIHALSEGYGFILSLMFTNDGTGTPYFSESEVNSMLLKMDNMWTVSNTDLSEMVTSIKSRFNI